MADGAIYNTLGVGMFLLLSFRAHEGYGRFWEGRKAWGRIRECCRDLTRQICYHIRLPPPQQQHVQPQQQPQQPQQDNNNNKDHDHDDTTTTTTAITDGSSSSRHQEALLERRRAVGFVGAFASTLKLTLRRERNPVPELGDILIFQDILNIEKANSSSMPQFCLDVLTFYLQKQVHEGNLGEQTLHAMTVTCLSPLMDAMGTTERIRNQPIPLSYSLHLRFFLVLWLVLYPIYLVGASYGWYAILLATLVDYAVLGIESMSCEIENPFGYHKNCIDLCGYCKGIVADTQSILNRLEHPHAPFVLEGKKVRQLNHQLFQSASSPEERKTLDQMLANRDVCRKEERNNHHGCCWGRKRTSKNTNNPAPPSSSSRPSSSSSSQQLPTSPLSTSTKVEIVC